MRWVCGMPDVFLISYSMTNLWRGLILGLREISKHIFTARFRPVLWYNFSLMSSWFSVACAAGGLSAVIWCFSEHVNDWKSNELELMLTRLYHCCVFWACEILSAKLLRYCMTRKIHTMECGISNALPRCFDPDPVWFSPDLDLCHA